MTYSSSLRIMTRILWIGAVGIFVTAEVMVFLALRKIPTDHLVPGIGTQSFIALSVALPMVVGMNGFYSVRRRLSPADDEALSTLSIQFLITIVTAYAALIVCMDPIVRALNTF